MHTCTRLLPVKVRLSGRLTGVSTSLEAIGHCPWDIIREITRRSQIPMSLYASYVLSLLQAAFLLPYAVEDMQSQTCI